jgi:hypothetical protein
MPPHPAPFNAFNVGKMKPEYILAKPGRRKNSQNGNYIVSEEFVDRTREDFT